MCVVLYQGSKICGCYVLMFGNRIVMKKIQKYKNFVGPLVIRLRYLLRTMPGGWESLHTDFISFVIEVRSS